MNNENIFELALHNMSKKDEEIASLRVTIEELKRQVEGLQDEIQYHCCAIDDRSYGD